MWSVCGHAPVNAGFALLPVNGGQRLPEGPVLVALLAQSRPGHLVRIGNARGNRLGAGAGQHEFEKVTGRLALGRMRFAQFDLAGRVGELKRYLPHFVYIFISSFWCVVFNM